MPLVKSTLSSLTDVRKNTRSNRSTWSKELSVKKADYHRKGLCADPPLARAAGTARALAGILFRGAVWVSLLPDGILFVCLCEGAPLRLFRPGNNNTGGWWVQQQGCRQRHSHRQGPSETSPRRRLRPLGLRQDIGNACCPFYSAC